MSDWRGLTCPGTVIEWVMEYSLSLQVRSLFPLQVEGPVLIKHLYGHLVNTLSMAPHE
jgi:hypothetical protein